VVRISLPEAVAIRVAEILELVGTDGIKLVGGPEPEITAALAALRGQEKTITGRAAPRVDPRKGRKLGPRKPKAPAEEPQTPAELERIAAAPEGE
jgi:hypothetical protein